MRRVILLLAILLGLVSPAVGGMDEEMEAAVAHLATVRPEDRPFVRFLTTFAYPENMQEDAALALSFWLGSLTGPPGENGGNRGYAEPIAKFIPIVVPAEKGHAEENVVIAKEFVPLRRVADSNTLWHIDIRDYNWTEEAFGAASIAEPYVRKPWISGDYDKLRLSTSSNAIMRADWFLVHTADTTRQFDRGIEPYYYQLLFAQVGVPKTIDEYRKAWGIDDKRVEEFGLGTAAVVDKGQSIVSRHTREIFGVRTDIGYHWETSDVKTQDNYKDFLENLSIERDENGIPRHRKLARKADAHEYITSTLTGLQAYFLTDGDGKRLEFADPTIVVDTSDRNGDMRVRQARSCVSCHAIGINPSRNELEKILGEKVDLLASYHDFAQAIKSYYLSPKLDQRTIDDQLIYSRGISEWNGLTPAVNREIFIKVLDWYDRDVDLEQAAKECGVTPEVFKEKVGRSTSVRLARLVQSGHAIPREIWENPKGGGFAQAMLLITGKPAISQQDAEKAIATTAAEEHYEYGVVNIEQAFIYVGDKPINQVKKGFRFKIAGRSDDGLYLKMENKNKELVGYLKASEVDVFQK